MSATAFLIFPHFFFSLIHFADDDWFHHLTFAFSLCGMSLVWDHGCLESWLIFFICGAPGGIDYFWLGLVKEGKIKKIDEKRWNAKVL